jgi:glycosyltransferase involved in cell wall biosynthesis
MMGKGFGLARYVEQLVLNLINIDTDDEFVFFVKDVGQLLEVRGQRSEVVKIDIPWYSLEEQTKLSKVIKRENIDLMHFPHWNVPLFYNDPFIVTIHDLIMFHYPRPEATTLGPLKFWLKDKAHRVVIKNAVKKARHIITTSEFTKHDVHKTLGVPLEKMTTIYQAPFSNHKSKIINHNSVLEKYKIRKPYVIYVGSAYPHKNLEGLLKAWEIFNQKHNNKYSNNSKEAHDPKMCGRTVLGQPYQLVLVGKEDYFWGKLMGSEVRGYGSEVVYTGFVNDQELSFLYDKASLYVFPSLYEGFGLPPLEAMSHCVPVVSSNRTCLPEVLGEAALYFDPENYEQVADVIYTGLTDEDIRFELKEKAREELKRYSSKKLAEQTLDIYSQIINEKS